jgi:ADP-heptose:LPS heptosyltransferase
MIDFIAMTGEIKSTSDPSRILVVRVGALGDTLMATPLIRMLHERYPQAEIDFLSSELAAPLLELNPHLAHLFRLRARNLPFVLSPEKRRLVRHLRAREYDLAVLLESAPRYRMLLKRARLRQIRSFAEVRFDPALHAIVNNLNVAGFTGAKPEQLVMDLSLSPVDQAAADRILHEISPPRIGVHIGWGPQGRKRNQAHRLRGWSRAGFIELIRRLLATHVSVVLTGSSEDSRDADLIQEQLGNRKVHSIAGRTKIRELAAVIEKLDLLISVDSGPCHMAAALGTPLVVLWGPGRLEQTRPLSRGQVCVIRHILPCAPCQSTPQQKTCTRNLCMEAITPEEVLAEARHLLPLQP